MTSLPNSRPKLSKLPFVLLGLMTLFSFGGPLAIGYVLAGGSSPRWPPDRAVEWATFIGVSAMVVIALVNQKQMSQARDVSKPEATRPEP
jgi:hypothetical protein